MKNKVHIVSRLLVILRKSKKNKGKRAKYADHFALQFSKCEQFGLPIVFCPPQPPNFSIYSKYFKILFSKILSLCSHNIFLIFFAFTNILKNTNDANIILYTQHSKTI